jgi:hypothetical protein
VVLSYIAASYFMHFCDNKTQEAAARARRIRYYKECVIPAVPGDPKIAPRGLRLLFAGALPDRGSSDGGVGEIQGNATGGRHCDTAAVAESRMKRCGLASFQ